MNRYVIVVLACLLALVAAPADAQNPDLVTFPNDQVAFIIGPQLKSGSALNPHPSFDRIAHDRGIFWGQQYPAAPPTDAAGIDWMILQNYYDQALVQYINFYRTGDPQFLGYARKIADAWWQGPAFKSGTITADEGMSPRNASAAGVMLRALDGHPEYWDGINRWTRAMFDMWLKTRVAYPQLYYGVRDGGYMLLYATQLAKVLPDTFPLTSGGIETHGADLRAQWLTDAQTIAVKYFGRLQLPDGSWRWDDPDLGYVGISQPFQVGLLLQALGDLHQLSTDATVKASLKAQITSAVTWMHRDCYLPGPSGLAGYNWRGYHYFCTGGTIAQPTIWAHGNNGQTPAQHTDDIAGVRALGQTLLHADGLAFRISGDPIFKAQGDDVFDAMFGDPGDLPTSDGVHNYAAGDIKSFNESFRTSGRFLVDRLGPLTPPVTPPVPVRTCDVDVIKPTSTLAATWQTQLAAKYAEGWRMVGAGANGMVILERGVCR